jgi:excisionase family DNA binding protein
MRKKKRVYTTHNKTIDPDTELLTFDQVASIINVSKMTVYNLVRRGKLIAVQLPLDRCTRIRKTSLDKMIAEAKPADIAPVGYSYGRFGRQKGSGLKPLR